MTQKTYRAPSMSEALAQMKRDLGRDAVILHTRNFRKGGFLGLVGGKPMWEITASSNANIPPRGGAYVPSFRSAGGTATAPAPEPRAVATLEEAVGESEPSPRRGGSLIEPAAKKPAAAPSTQVVEEMPLDAQVRQIRGMVEALLAMQNASGGLSMPAELRVLRRQLIEQEVDEQVADELIRELTGGLTGQQLADGNLARCRLAELIAAKVLTPPARACGPATGRARVAAFIGPTGVGKTTTIAKLAANFKLREGKKVGLITIDTYRIAAVDQLKIFAEIIELPLQVVLTAGELRQAVESMSKDHDVVLIDTAGRSQNDRLRLSQLSNFLKAANPDEIHLVIAATANRAVVVSTLERFMPLGVNRIIMSKLDEATALGAVLNVAAAGQLPISYVTIGQDVPDDIAPADPTHLARCIMEGNRYVNG